MLYVPFFTFQTYEENAHNWFNDQIIIEKSKYARTDVPIYMYVCVCVCVCVCRYIVSSIECDIMPLSVHQTVGSIKVAEVKVYLGQDYSFKTQSAK